MPKKAYFDSPRNAVESLRRMLRAEDWAGIAPFYDLDGTSVDIQSLLSGDFFIREKRPEICHPGGFWRYKHPFPPAFEFFDVSLTPQPGVVIVRMRCSIDQGAGAPLQEGWSAFRMRHTEEGYQVIPDVVA